MFFCEGFLIILFHVEEITVQTLMLCVGLYIGFYQSSGHQKKPLLYISVVTDTSIFEMSAEPDFSQSP